MTTLGGHDTGLPALYKRLARERAGEQGTRVVASAA
jgi:hypothetical protein